MAQQLINLGTSADSGTGETIRSAMTKVNANFTELYARSVNFVDTFGAVSNTIETTPTTNETAWRNFINYAVGESDAGRSVVLHIPPGYYRYRGNNVYHTYDGITQYNSFAGIRNLTIIGYGATVENIYDADANFGYSKPFMDQHNAIIQGFVGNTNFWQIANTDVLANSVNLIYTGQYTKFNVGQYYLIASTNIQPSGGFPYNTDRFDFAICTAAYANGRIEFDRTFKTPHSSNSGIDNTSEPIADAKIWDLKAHWDLEHVYAGLTIPYYAPGGAQEYITVGGKSVRFVDCVLPGLSCQYGISHIFDRCLFTSTAEPDKIVEYLGMTECINKELFTLQSSSIHRVYINSCRFDKGLNIGPTQSVTIENSEIGIFGFGLSCGFTRNVTLKNTVIREFPYSPNIGGTYHPVSLGAATMTYANGLFTFAKANTATQGYIPRVVQGQKIAFVGPNEIHPGDIGTGIITSITQNATHGFIQTTIPQATWPAWADQTKLRSQIVGNLKMINCRGCVNAVMASRAFTLGLQPDNYYGGTVDGRMGNWYTSRPQNGPLKQIRFRVNRAGPAGAKLRMACGTRYTTNTAVAEDFIVDFDLATVGERIWTYTSLTKQGTDAAALGSNTAITGLPSDRSLSGTLAFSAQDWTPSTTHYHQTPHFEFDLIFDSGTFINSSGPVMFGNSTVSPLMYDGNP